MVQALERLKVRSLVWWQWKKSPEKLLNSLRIFESTEDDSAWQLLKASEFISEAHLKAELFEQIVEETFHAQEFRKVYKLMAQKPMVKLTIEKKALFLKEKANDVFAYCVVGEKSAADRFAHIAESLDEGPLKQMLNRLVSDEVGHIHKATELLNTLNISDSQLKREIVKIKITRLYEHWLRLGRNITGTVSELILNLIYFSIIGVFAKTFLKGKKS